MAEENLSSQQILQNLREEDEVCHTIIRDVLAEERLVMYNKRRPKIHETLYKRIEELVK